MTGGHAKDVHGILLGVLVDAIALRAKSSPAWNCENSKSPVFRRIAMSDGDVRYGWVCE